MLKQPKEQILSMKLGGMDVTFAVDLSSLPPIDDFVSLPIRITAAAEKPPLGSIRILDESSSGLDLGPRELGVPWKEALSGHALINDFNELMYGNDRPTLMLVGELVLRQMQKIPGFTDTFEGARVWQVPSLPSRMAVFINREQPNNPKLNRVVEYA